MLGKIVAAIGIGAAMVQLLLQLYLQRHPQSEMSDWVYWPLFGGSGAILIACCLYMAWIVVVRPVLNRVPVVVEVRRRDNPPAPMPIPVRREPNLILHDQQWDHSAYSRPSENHISQLLVRLTVAALDEPITVAIFRFDIEGFGPYFMSEYKKDERNEYLVPPGGGWSLIPNDLSWLKCPIRLQPGDSETGWIGFNPTGAVPFVTYGDLRRLAAAQVVAQLADGRELSVSLPIPAPPDAQTNYPGNPLPDN